MCLDGNNASHASNYINAQLNALWSNSVECVTHHAQGLKAYERVRFDFALAEFFYAPRHRSKVAAVEDMMFAAEFHSPRLEFICNHEAIFHVAIHSGHLNLDFAKAAHPGFIPSRDRNVPFTADIDVALRVRFSTSAIGGHSSKIGNGAHIIQLMVLDTSNPRFVYATEIENVQVREALVFYMTKYFEYLRDAGRHVFYSLPDFDNDGKHLHIDYSLTCDRKHLDFEGIDFSGISIGTVNTHLSSVWLQAAMLAERLEEGDIHIDYHSVCLAEYHSTWTDIGHSDGLQFRIKFDAPRVRILCDREAVLFFKISEIAYFSSDDFAVEAIHVFENWEIAFFVDLVYERNTEGTIVNIKFNFDTRRFVEHLCVYGEHDVDIENFDYYQSILIDFFEHFYFTILEEAERHIIYTHSTTIVVTQGGDYDDDAFWQAVDLGKHHDDITIIREDRITKTHMFGFDYIQAITQSSILEYFESLWRLGEGSTLDYLTCLTKWSYETYFESSFGPIKVRLLSDKKAIVFLKLQSGTMFPLRNQTPYTAGGSHAFSDWTLAFEVDIKMVDYEELVETCGPWATRFKDSPAWKHHGEPAHVHLCHIILDFSAAEFIHELSVFDGLYAGDRHAIALVRSSIHYMKHHYFPLLTLHGHHILYTIPVWGSRLDIPAFGLTSVNFHIYSKVKYTRHNCFQLSPLYQPVIMIVGMCDFREWPAEYLEYSAEWVIRIPKRITYGTISISRKLFFEQRLLSILAKVNKSTTIIPTFSGVEAGEWILEVATWAEHERKSQANCDWQLVKESADALEYVWDHGDEWSYEHHGMSQDSKNGVYWVHSHTHNDLTIPTAFKHGGLEIKVKGTVVLEIGFKKPGREWSTKAVASWSSVVAFVTEGSGLGVRVYGETRPAINTTHIHSELINTRFTALQKLLETHLPSKIDLAELSQELQTSFCGEWKFCYPGLAAYGLVSPIFNRHGDILFDIRPFNGAGGLHLQAPRLSGRGVPSPLGSRSVSRAPSFGGGWPKSPKSPLPSNNQPASSPLTRDIKPDSPLIPVDFTDRSEPVDMANKSALNGGAEHPAGNGVANGGAPATNGNGAAPSATEPVAAKAASAGVPANGTPGGLQEI